MADLLVDTDVLVDHLRGVARFRPGRNRIVYSVITRCELFAGRASEEEVIRGLLAPFSEIQLSRDLAESAGRVRREVGMPLADAVIAATALGSGAAVLTRNGRHFERVPGLRVRAPR